MIFEDDLAFAEQLDGQDSLKDFRNEFLIPRHDGSDVIYLCGNSLGLQPKTAEQYIKDQLDQWRDLAVEGWFQGEDPWLGFQKKLLAPLSNILGTREDEITIMNSLTVNLHLLFVSFYKPTKKRFKILIEAGAFPSDQYAVESQLNFHGFDLNDALIEVYPRQGEYILRTEDILEKIDQYKDEIALVLFSGINYYTGQFFDLKAITNAAHAVGAIAGFDLAHAAGNVPLYLHDWDIDFACWCSYKYMNSGPGGISGIFVHERHFNNKDLKRFAGWWGYRDDTRFLMAQGFEPAYGAAGWQVSTSPIILLALHKASLEIFQRAGGMHPLRSKSEMLTAYLAFLVDGINTQYGEELFKIITPKNSKDRGCQLSLICKRDGKEIFNYLAKNGVVGDWREPDVIRLSPIPLYNSFKDVYRASKCLEGAVTHLRR
jgi:kynureninase